MSMRRPEVPELEDRLAAEAPLLRGCLAGERGALDALYDAHVDRVSRVIRRLVGPNHDLEDLVQATFAAAFASLRRYRGEASLSTWIVRIAVHVTTHHLRQRSQRPVSLEVLAERDEPREPAASAERQLDDRRVARRVHALLDRIRPRNRVALLLYVVEGYSMEEVAALMGATRTATKSRVWLARRELLKLARRDPVLRDVALAALRRAR